MLENCTLLMMTCGGGCPRATELGSSLWCNTQGSMRSFYVSLDHFMWVADYGKAESRTHTPRVIARFYPQAIRQIMIALLTEVRPFYKLLCELYADVQEHHYSDLVFHTEGRP